MYIPLQNAHSTTECTFHYRQVLSQEDSLCIHCCGVAKPSCLEAFFFSRLISTPMYKIIIIDLTRSMQITWNTSVVQTNQHTLGMFCQSRPHFTPVSGYHIFLYRSQFTPHRKPPLYADPTNLLMREGSRKWRGRWVWAVAGWKFGDGEEGCCLHLSHGQTTNGFGRWGGRKENPLINENEWLEKHDKWKHTHTHHVNIWMNKSKPIWHEIKTHQSDWRSASVNNQAIQTCNSAACIKSSD